MAQILIEHLAQFRISIQNDLRMIIMIQVVYLFLDS